MTRLLLKIALAFLVGWLLAPAFVSAQTMTVLSPSIPPMVEFDPSTDHAATQIDPTTGITVDLVAAYQLDAVAMNALGVIVWSLNLGKPVVTAGKIIVTVPTLSTIAQNQSHTITSTAIGPGGTGVSLPSNPFGYVTATLKAPSAPSNVRVSRSAS